MLRVRYQTLELPNIDLHVRSLWDKQQFEDPGEVAEQHGVSPASWAFSGVIWPSAYVLARLMCDFPIAGKRILEVGCGLGLASLVLSGRYADITATDHNPAVEGFLVENTRLNASSAIPFVRAGWTDAESDLGRFDLIIGSDLLYEPDHAAQLSAFIHRHAAVASEVILVDAGRGFHNKFCRALEGLGYVGHIDRSITMSNQGVPFKGCVVRYQNRAVG